MNPPASEGDKQRSGGEPGRGAGDEGRSRRRRRKGRQRDRQGETGEAGAKDRGDRNPGHGQPGHGQPGHGQPGRKRSGRRDSGGDPRQPGRRGGYPGPRAILTATSLALVVGGLGVAAVFIFLPFLGALLAAVLITTVAWPIFQRTLRLVGERRRALASGLTCATLLLLILLPAAFFTRALLSDFDSTREELKVDAPAFFTEVEKHEWVEEFLWREDGTRHSVWVEVLRAVEGALGLTEGALRPVVRETPADVAVRAADPVEDPVDTSAEDTLEDALSEGFTLSSGGVANVLRWLTTAFAGILAGILGLVIKAALTLFLVFYFFKDGPQMLKSLESVLPIDMAYQVKVVERFEEVSRAMIRGILATALAQGVLAGTAFWFLGLRPLFWGALVAFSALIPVIGTAVVTVPLTLAFVLRGEYGSAAACGVVGVVISLLDNILRPFFIEGNLSLHPVWILLSILGGVTCFGALGLILGPMVVVLLRTMVLLVMESGADEAPAQ